MTYAAPVGYEELAGGLEPIRNGEYFEYYNNEKPGRKTFLWKSAWPFTSRATFSFVQVQVD